ncbi:signal recognition particle-docking protein FtsY [Pseudonocardia phyllosphaerae]|uniref:signal recognition particle-docking protein FtsY n=1 Tax=Pseudonocardia phyllosphaerae TaxID=3390502 RepID=UPI003979F2BE
MPVSTAPPVRADRPSSPTVPTEQRSGSVLGTPQDGRVIDTAEASKDPATQQLRRDGGTAASGTADGSATQQLPASGTAGTAAAGTGAAGAAALAGGAAGTREPRTEAIPAQEPATVPTEQEPAEQPTEQQTEQQAGREGRLRDSATAPVAPGAPTEEIAPADGRLNRLRGRLSRSRSGLGQSLLGLLGAGDLDDESWEDVEATLLQADLGPETTLEITDKLREQLAARGARTAADVRQILHDVLTETLETPQDRSVHALRHDDGRPAVVLVVGVNGTGKTTTTGKLARVLVGSGLSVTLGAADTFRAAAAEQLVTWGERSGAGVVRGPEGADPASVAFDAVKTGTDDGVDAVLLDTAGRLHTKTGLMDELGKVKRVVEKQAKVDEVLLVLDATTGQNGLTQARVFGEVVEVTGIVLTKLDGTAKGGIVFRVQRELGVPVKLVGLGEGPDDLAPFEPKAFVDALLD